MPTTECPYELGEAGRAWWNWAWTTPQSKNWDPGSLYTVARRAQLEDDLAALTFDDGLAVSLDDLLAGSDPEAIKRVEFALNTLQRNASGEIVVMKEMRELETQLGLGPKALIGLGWKPEEEKRDGVDDLSKKRAARLAGGASAADMPRS